MDSRFRGNDKGKGENAKIDFSEVKDKLKINQEKQSKLTDAYLENLLSEDVYREKNSSLRTEEENLKKLLAGYELREIERERSESYISRVKDFLDGYDDNKEKIDFATKKQLAGLLFKNIKIAPAIGGSLPPLIFCFQKQKENRNVKRIKNLQKYAEKSLHPYLRLTECASTDG